MNRVAAGLDKVSNALGQWIGWLIFIMMLTTAVIVVMRYFLNLGSIPLQETVLYLHGTALMLGMGYTLKTDGHVRVDVLHRRLTPRQKIWVDLVGFGVFRGPCWKLQGHPAGFQVFFFLKPSFQSWRFYCCCKVCPNRSKRCAA